VVNGEVDVAAGSVLPAKLDVFVKSTPNIFTVALTKVGDTKATWTINVGQNKLALGNHTAYAVATQADASQIRSPEANFSVATVQAAKNHKSLVIEASAAAVALIVGALLAVKWHKKHQHQPAPVTHEPTHS
jgi:hypothetical protein